MNQINSSKHHHILHCNHNTLTKLNLIYVREFNRTRKHQDTSSIHQASMKTLLYQQLIATISKNPHFTSEKLGLYIGPRLQQMVRIITITNGLDRATSALIRVRAKKRNLYQCNKESTTIVGNKCPLCMLFQEGMGYNK